MAIFQNKRLANVVIAADRAAILALRRLSSYAPPNPSLSTETVNDLEARLRETEEAEILAAQALEAARDARTSAGWALHNTMLDVKSAVRSQYGPNSDEIQALGLKKKADYRRPNSKGRTDS